MNVLRKCCVNTFWNFKIIYLLFWSSSAIEKKIQRSQISFVWDEKRKRILKVKLYFVSKEIKEYKYIAAVVAWKLFLIIILEKIK